MRLTHINKYNFKLGENENNKRVQELREQKKLKYKIKKLFKKH